MDNNDFRTLFAGVRPPRVAVIINQNDLHWSDTCVRIIECLSTMWGGKHSMIVPTDGTRVEEVFWELLEAFDPDYICDYQKTGLDLKLASPAEFDARLQQYLDQQYADDAQTEDARAQISEALEKSYFMDPGLSAELEREIRVRLAPFFHEERLLLHSFSARSEPDYPFTTLPQILPHCDHRPIYDWAAVSIDGVPTLWAQAVLGATYEGHVDRLVAAGVTVERTSVNFPKVYGLTTVQIADRRRNRPANYFENSPFEFGMASLSQYVPQSERAWKMPVIVVVGFTLQDFALYFNLSRIRPSVCWFLPAWTQEPETGDAPNPDSPGKQFARALLNVVAAAGGKTIEFVSKSLDGIAVMDVIEYLDTIAGGVGQITIKARASYRESAMSLCDSPRVVFNTDNFANPSTHQIIDSKIVGFFSSPKPKGFARIVPYDHRWITELRIEGLSYPRHPELGKWLIRHKLLDSEGARSGRDGLSYACPSPMYFGGDVDTILIRPELFLPTAESTIAKIAESVTLTTKTSDKGFYSKDITAKMRGVEFVAALIRDAKYFAVLRSYLAKGPQTNGGLYLRSDRRRYLTLADISAILEDADNAVTLTDLLLRRGIMRRGTILKCQYCRTADWFSMSQLADEFACKRCGRRQWIQSGQALGQSEPHWYYQLDEVAYQGLLNDMHVPLLALDYLRRHSKSFSYADEQEVWKPGLPRPFIEVDICCICDGVLTLGEAKITDRIDGGGKQERRSLAKYREVVSLLGARSFVLATPQTWATETRKNVEAAFRGTNVVIKYLEGAQILSAIN